MTSHISEKKRICSSFCSPHRSRSVTAGSDERRLYSQARVSGNNVPLFIHFDGSRHEDIFQQLVNDNASQCFLLLGGARASHVWPSHKMQRTFLNWRKSVDLVSARALNNQARYKYHQSKLIPSPQVRNTSLLFGSAQFLEF